MRRSDGRMNCCDVSGTWIDLNHGSCRGDRSFDGLRIGAQDVNGDDDECRDKRQTPDRRFFKVTLPVDGVVRGDDYRKALHCAQLCNSMCCLVIRKSLHIVLRRCGQWRMEWRLPSNGDLCQSNNGYLRVPGCVGFFGIRGASKNEDLAKVDASRGLSWSTEPPMKGRRRLRRFDLCRSQP